MGISKDSKQVGQVTGVVVIGKNSKFKIQNSRKKEVMKPG
jgi:hypothetical protein